MSKPVQLESRAFYTREAPELARDLLGTIMVTTVQGMCTAGRIVEVEAYRQEEPACHCYGGKTDRNRSMFLIGGHIYVYFIYGMHYCVNIVAGNPDYGEAVLLRAVEPVKGMADIRKRRGDNVRERDLTNGPGKLTKGLGIGRQHDGCDLLDSTSPIQLLPGTPVPDSAVEQTTRVGITKAVDFLWRWKVVDKKG